MIQRRNSVQTLVPDIVEKWGRGVVLSNIAPNPPLNILVIPPSNPPSNVDKVTGFNDKTDAKWDDMSGTATSAEICRLNALQSDGKYVAWGYRGDGNGGYSNSCFLYKNFPPGFEGNDPGVGKIMESGCLNSGELVKFGCKKPVPIDCTLTPSDSPYGECSDTQCGNSGIQTRKRYKILTPSMYGGKCDNENEMEKIECKNAPCPVDCVLTPSNIPYGTCSAVGCGNSGIQTRKKYKILTPSMYGGECVNKNEMEKIDCKNAPCPVDCILEPTPSDSPFSPCSTNECGVTGIRSRKKYRIATPSMHGGTCGDENLMESTHCVVPHENCLIEVRSKNQNPDKINLVYFIGAGVLFVILILLIVMKKK